jgi:hypothetical protein
MKEGIGGHRFGRSSNLSPSRTGKTPAPMSGFFLLRRLRRPPRSPTRWQAWPEKRPLVPPDST